jgi:hypothetical protein
MWLNELSRATVTVEHGEPINTVPKPTVIPPLELPATPGI